MKPEVQKDYDRIIKNLEGTGRGTEHQPLVAEYLEKELKAFFLQKEYDFPDGVKMYEEMHYGQNEKKTGMYPQRVYAELHIPVEIPTKEIEGILTGDLENRLQNPPDAELVTPENRHEFEAMSVRHQQEISRDLKVIMEKEPDIFVQFLEKYKPKVDFAIPEELKKKQEQLHEDHHPTNTFSSYFNLSPLEIYHSLRYGTAAIHKTLFRKAKPGEEVALHPDGTPQNVKYSTWVKVDYSQPPDEFGAHPVIMPKGKRNFSLVRDLNLHNFNEMLSESLGRSDKIQFMMKGGPAVFTNNNPTGERKVIAIADPFAGEVKLRKLNGEPIYNHNDYLKNPVIREVEKFKEITRRKQGTEQTLPRPTVSRAPFAKGVTPEGKRSDRFTGQPDPSEGQKSTASSGGQEKPAATVQGQDKPSDKEAQQNNTDKKGQKPPKGKQHTSRGKNAASTNKPSLRRRLKGSHTVQETGQGTRITR